MKTPLFKIGAALALLCLFNGCVNDDYDLSDIDTTTQIKVNDLTIPVNIDVVNLGDIITFDENSKIQPVTIDGQTFYALRETGSFESDPIEINSVTAPAPVLAPTEDHLDQLLAPRAAAAGSNPLLQPKTYEIKDMGNDIHYNAGHVDEAIVDLDFIEADMSLTITLEALNAGNSLESVLFENVVLQLPKGLVATTEKGTYDPVTGLWDIPSHMVTTSTTSLTLFATGVNFKQAGAEIDADHSFDYKGEFRIKSGLVTITPSVAAITELPASLYFRASYSVSDMVAKSFSGMVNYRLDGFDIDPVSLSDIPDFLSGEGTNIRLANPQIYLQVNNPVAGNKLNCSTGITLTAMREGAPDLTFSPDNGAFVIGHEFGIDGPYNFVLAPSITSLTIPDIYKDNLNFVEFTSLTGLVATPENFAVVGLPDRIGIHMDDPQVYDQRVTDFHLGVTLPGVRGSYEMVAPLALENGSMIVYTDRQDGWNDEDVDAITITTLSLTATITNNCPVGVELTAWPIDVNGERIKGVEVRSSHVDANAADVPLVISMTGEVRHLDGVIFEARVNGSSNSTALAPDQTITIKNVRAKVSGYYEKEL